VTPESARFRPTRSDLLLVFSAGAAVALAWLIGIADPATEVQTWVRNNQFSHPLFTSVIDPSSDAVKWAVNTLSDAVASLPWFTIPLASGLLLATTSVGRLRLRQVVVRAVAIALIACLPGLFGLAKTAAETTALMTVSVLIALLIGIPLGVAAALNRHVKRVLRPLLDAMQTVPSTVYLVPATLFFGIGVVPAVAATVVFALPPAVRLTMLGISEVPVASVEAGQMFGSSRWQLLRKVQFPLAKASIATGINQTIMMALGIVVVASLVGAGGLGQDVLESLQIRAPGRGMVVGIAIVALATVLDRVSGSFVSSDRRLTQLRGPSPTLMRRVLVGGAIALGVTSLIGWGTWNTPPLTWGTAFADPVDTGVTWIRDNAAWLTRPLNDFVVRDILIRGRDLLVDVIPPPLTVALFTAGAWRLGGWRLALGVATGLSVIGGIGTWASSMETLVQVITATIVALAVALPIGISIGRRPRLERAIGPVLDALQTIPSLIYTIPFVMIFTVSVVPGGIIASALYAIPAGIRVAALGLRSVATAPLEASTSFGATKRQTLWGVALPLAKPALLLAVNQVIMMVLSMVVIAGMTGAGALGYEAVKALTLNKTGLGAQVGLSIVILAMLLDRVTERAAGTQRAPRTT
jgi:glycine betaine/proline transport system permease protein